ncbi:gdsl-like lipase/acylhydrolase domain protein [Anaeramoeba flamelloides]|uniref:Gdsl-like lipase/acylhydrolase domain protein n=1 Tax=Anaeramoeba flamelloides TaxID=1746091 RepID=A0AAV7Z155_9EUKA|nr:gdsl-like lipase/acylhydrolase domain protein [Anaeramoeba flamelloides]
MKNLLFFSLLVFLAFSKVTESKGTTPHIEILGRYFYDQNEKIVYLDWPGVRINVDIPEGTQKIEIEVTDTYPSTVVKSKPAQATVDSHSSYFQMFLDGNPLGVLKIPMQGGLMRILVSDRVDPTKSHLLSMYKRTEAKSLVGIKQFLFNEGAKLAFNPSMQPDYNKYARRLEFLGDSVCVGYGNNCTSVSEPFTTLTEDNYMSYSSIIPRMFNAIYFDQSISGIGVVRNYGDPDPSSKRPYGFYQDSSLKLNVSDTTKWDYSKFLPHAVIYHIGGNDYGGSGQYPTETVFVQHFLELIESRRKLYGDNIPIFISSGPLDGPWDFQKEVVSKAGDNVYWIDWTTIYEDGGGMGCQYHPDIKSHKMMSQILAKLIQNVLGWDYTS